MTEMAYMRGPAVEVGTVSDFRCWLQGDKGRIIPVTHLFDGAGSETHDPTAAVEAETDDGLIKLEDGATLIITAVY